MLVSIRNSFYSELCLFGIVYTRDCAFGIVHKIRVQHKQDFSFWNVLVFVSQRIV